MSINRMRNFSVLAYLLVRFSIAGYSDLVWGLTASFNPWGYNAHSPTNDNGTIAPTAALSAMPYVPAESIATLKEFYHTYGEDLSGAVRFLGCF